MANQNYDLIIIGGGSAGLTAAGFAVQLGKKVALVEKDRLGGDCTWTGCVPSKALVKSAKVAHDMRHANRYGVGPAEPVIDIRAVLDHVRSVVDQVYQPESPDALRAEGVDVHLGQASFVDPHTITVGEARLSAHRFLIATGAHPFIPPIDGLDSVDYLTYESIWDLESLPKRLVVIGGGPIGCELAQALCRLGAGVTLLEDDTRILPQEEPEVSALIQQQMAEDGVEFRLNSRAQRIWKQDGEIHIVAGGQELTGDALLLSVGRRPTVDGLDLEQAGIEYSSRGIAVNDQLRTSQRHIYAAGDCTGGYQFTHYAGFQGFMAVRNALLPGAATAVLDRVPSATFTDPEIAHVGLTEAQASEKYGDGAVVCSWPMERVDRAITEGDTAGFIKIVHRPDGTILGVTIANSRAGEMIQEWILAMDRRMKIGELVNSLHIYPTYSMASQQAALHIKVGQMLTGTSGRIIRGLARLMR
ncbi:MAG: mercuric reductase [Chloroflexi bacterium]|nr:mercuric reductase [Chloroflexota bacterium]MDA1217967.1 mercuric reductase [Chloroflexota bacterium]PKB57707.1 MAG: hypothetical protein BZY73_01825 [SAR202 cluster bacterium Casp-Chloro-G3]